MTIRKARFLVESPENKSDLDVYDKLYNGLIGISIDYSTISGSEVYLLPDAQTRVKLWGCGSMEDNRAGLQIRTSREEPASGEGNGLEKELLDLLIPFKPELVEGDKSLEIGED